MAEQLQGLLQKFGK